MINYDEIAEIAKECGFTNTAPLDVDTIVLRQEVRDMCAAGKCQMYGKCWSCPPGCGTLEECDANIRKYKKGLLVQTVGELEDVFDGEAMIETAKKQADNVFKMQDALIEKGYTGFLTLGAGACKICKECTYPNAPCRLPNKMNSSMEAYGMVVMDVCKANNLQYYYGSDHIAYTGCFLFE